MTTNKPKEEIHKLPGKATYLCKNMNREPLIDFPTEPENNDGQCPNCANEKLEELVINVSNDIRNGKYDTIPYCTVDEMKMVPLNFVESLVRQLLNKQN
ncbi:MAG: hypothetical protein Edafosvirus2_85 [Edafosvirus sp.]|uniref:Uncharacterized protein n=1 Tax=Edafosvirus sp. TaxID=2487765 RepID=A0A3G4ZSM8_9VIRU|nr:MAG: hypothetical protein Edafosvirus2_85 [Edafosvirus sp.]